MSRSKMIWVLAAFVVAVNALIAATFFISAPAASAEDGATIPQGVERYNVSDI